jgi:hypothetical protein
MGHMDGMKLKRKLVSLFNALTYSAIGKTATLDQTLNRHLTLQMGMKTKNERSQPPRARAATRE